MGDKKKWGRELYTSCHKVSERNAIALFKL